MKTFVMVFMLNLLLWKIANAQKLTDTLSIESVDVIALRVPKSYKSTLFDSLSISESSNLSELLQKHSPIFVKTYGLGSLATVSFRGTGASHTKVLWNDIPLNSPMNGQIDFSLYPTLFIDNAELHYGASGLIDGSGALGGSVNLSNTPVYDKGFETTLQQSVGSYSTYVSAGKFSFSKKKWFIETSFYNKLSKNNFNYINIAMQDQPSVMQNNADLKQYGLQQAIFRKLKNGSIGGRIWYFNSDRMLPADMLTLSNNQNQKDESLRAFIEWNGLRGIFKYKWISAFIKDKLNYNDSQSLIYSKNNSYIFSNKVFTKLYLKNNFVLINDISVSYEQAKADGYDAEHTRYNNSWLLGLTKSIKRFNFDIFNRFMQVSINTQLLSPTAGVRYDLLKSKQLTLRFNVGINHNYPTFNDLYWNPGGNLNLKPEQAKMIELGAKHTHLFKKHTKLTFEATSFYSYVYDWIIWTPTPSGYWSPSNLKEVENKGIELGLKVKTTIHKLTFNANANFSTTFSTNKKARSVLDHSINKQLIYVPYHQINYTVIISYKNYRLNYNYSYTGKRFITTDNNWYLPANFISDVSLSKKIKISAKSIFNVSFKINNLLNQNYQSIAWRAMPGRNYLFTLTYHVN